ncbi:unnamed protein product [Cuscuta campestris]|uniref:Uncharacterized protein n=1 Tax=Cuscuta campestris TaxID=132261 RepID=A0A484L5S6_9ASTE|nr:unnamed protein product [Cuscuta campestris]
MYTKPTQYVKPNAPIHPLTYSFTYAQNLGRIERKKAGTTTNGTTDGRTDEAAAAAARRRPSSSSLQVGIRDWMRSSLEDNDEE